MSMKYMFVFLVENKLQSNYAVNEKQEQFTLSNNKHLYLPISNIQVILLMSEKRSLTPAQIQYLRMGPKVSNSSVASKQLSQNLNQQSDGTQSGNSLSSIPRFTFGNFQKTVSNFGVLLHRNFVGSSTLHQTQKYGDIAVKMDKYMQQQNDKPTDQKKNGLKKNFTDSRTSIKTIHDFKGNKLLLTLHSFTIETVQTRRLMQTLPILFLKLLVGHVGGSKLLKTIQGSMRQDGNTFNIDYQKMQGKAGHSINNEIKYQQSPYLFEKGGQQLALNLPHLQIYHSQSEFKQNINIDNKDILDIIETDFDNAEFIFKKYFNASNFEQYNGKTGVDRRSIPNHEQSDDAQGLFG